MPQDQLEPVLRVAGQLRIRGLDSDYSRESSMEPERPGSQQSGSSKRKNSPKFHFLKNRRKNLAPSRLRGEDVKTEDPCQEDAASIQDEDEVESPEQTMTEGPVDFTVKCEQVESPNPREEQDMSDMAAFIASATAAVRSAGAGSFQARHPLPSSPAPF